jgi:putative hydrolase
MTDPFSGGFDPRMFENVPLFRELAKVMSWSGGPVNWDLARQTAEAIAEADAGPAKLPSAATVGFTAGDRESEEFAEAVRVAELWLDQVTSLPEAKGPARIHARVDWIRMACSSEGLGVYVEPVAEGMSAALAKQLPEELAGMGGPLTQAMGAMGAMLYGVQIGTVAGHLSGQLLGTYDLALPTVQPGSIGPVSDNARRFAADFEFDQTEFRYWLALREAAHRRQFQGVDWLLGHVRELIKRFASQADFDPGSMMEQLGGMGFDPTSALGDPEALREAFSDPETFQVELTAGQRSTLEALQAVVAFTEAWVDRTVQAAAGDKLTALPRIDEAIRRRRAEKGPGERFLEQLIGLDLKPADVRLGQAFCDAVIAARGQEGLDRAWQRPAHLPSAAELAEPSRWLVRMAAAELDLPEEPPAQDVP